MSAVPLPTTFYEWRFGSYKFDVFDLILFPTCKKLEILRTTGIFLDTCQSQRKSQLHRNLLGEFHDWHLTAKIEDSSNFFLLIAFVLCVVGTPPCQEKNQTCCRPTTHKVSHKNFYFIILSLESSESYSNQIFDCKISRVQFYHIQRWDDSRYCSLLWICFVPPPTLQLHAIHRIFVTHHRTITYQSSFSLYCLRSCWLDNPSTDS